MLFSLLYLKSSRPVGILTSASCIKKYQSSVISSTPVIFSFPCFQHHVAIVDLIFPVTSSSRIFSARSSFLTNILPCSSHALTPGQKPLGNLTAPQASTPSAPCLPDSLPSCSTSCFITSTTASFCSFFLGCAYLVSSTAHSLLALELALFPRGHDAFVI